MTGQTQCLGPLGVAYLNGNSGEDLVGNTRKGPDFLSQSGAKPLPGTKGPLTRLPRGGVLPISPFPVSLPPYSSPPLIPLPPPLFPSFSPPTFLLSFSFGRKSEARTTCIKFLFEAWHGIYSCNPRTWEGEARRFKIQSQLGI